MSWEMELAILNLNNSNPPSPQFSKYMDLELAQDQKSNSALVTITPVKSIDYTMVIQGMEF